MLARQSSQLGESSLFNERPRGAQMRKTLGANLWLPQSRAPSHVYPPTPYAHAHVYPESSWKEPQTQVKMDDFGRTH